MKKWQGRQRNRRRSDACSFCFGLMDGKYLERYLIFLHILPKNSIKGISAKEAGYIRWDVDGKLDDWADCPKTQKSILKVEETHHSPDVLKDKVGINMNIEAVQDTKMENDRRSETVFGQSGGDYVHKYELSNHIDKFFNAFFLVRIFCGRTFLRPLVFLKSCLESVTKEPFPNG